MKITMIRFFLMMVLAFTAVSCGQETANGEGAQISTTFKNADGESVYLEDVNGASAYSIDTLKVKGSKGSFSAIVEPGIYRIRASEHPGNPYALVFLDNETKLNFSMDLDDPKNYKVSGNEENVMLKNTLFRQDELVGQARQIQEELRTERDFNRKDSLNRKYRELAALSTSEIKKAIDESSDMDPNLSAYLLNLLDPKTELAYINTQLKTLATNDPDSKLIKRMVSHYTVSQKRKSGVAIGAVAPEISQSSPDGVNIALSSLQGKFVLIDFWASWCRPCRFENPNVVRTYHKYKDVGPGFDIYSVSLDKNKDRWAKAIQDDGLVWESHVSDLKAWSNQAARDYGVGSIPATFLIDPEGKVIARNLRGNMLEEKLKEVLGDG